MKKPALFAGPGLLACLLMILALPAGAQYWPYVPPTNPMAQNNAMNLVLNQVRLCQNATRASSYMNGYGLLSSQFQEVRNQYAGFKGTLTPWQSGYGGNRLADLDAGLDIIQEAFTHYQTAVANGQLPSHAFNNLKQVLNRAMGAWAQEFKQVCSQIRVGS
ncbi:MAG TPA: hypothetical protein VMU04_14395 [Candidatus Acidoferrum sp.]|nr:hypothetical protein [Candidatus Acidoferrum sp.]